MNIEKPTVARPWQLASNPQQRSVVQGRVVSVLAAAQSGHDTWTDAGVHYPVSVVRGHHLVTVCR